MADTTYCFTLNNDRKLTKLTKGNDTLIDTGEYDLDDATNIANAATGSTPASTLTDNKPSVAPVFGQENPPTGVNMENKTPVDEIMVKNKEGENEVNKPQVKDLSKSKNDNKSRPHLFNPLYSPGITKGPGITKSLGMTRTELNKIITAKQEEAKVDRLKKEAPDSSTNNNGSSKFGGKHTRKHKV